MAEPAIECPEFGRFVPVPGPGVEQPPPKPLVIVCQDGRMILRGVIGSHSTHPDQPEPIATTPVVMLTPPDSGDGDTTDDEDWHLEGLQALRQATWKNRRPTVEAHDARAALFEQRIRPTAQVSQATAGSRPTQRSRADSTLPDALVHPQRQEAQEGAAAVPAAQTAGDAPQNLFNHLMHQSMSRLNAAAYNRQYVPRIVSAVAISTTQLLAPGPTRETSVSLLSQPPPRLKPEQLSLISSLATGDRAKKQQRAMEPSEGPGFQASESAENRGKVYRQQLRAREGAGDAAAIAQIRRKNELERARRQRLRQSARDGDEDACAWVRRQQENRARSRKQR